MSLADLAAPASTDLKVEGTREEVGFSGLVTENPLDPKDAGAFSKIFELSGLSQTEYRLIENTFKFSTWQQSKATEDGKRDLIQLYSYSGRFARLTKGDLDADEATNLLLLADRMGQKPRKRKKALGTKTRVVIISDPQIGKVDNRGGTPELLARIAWLRDELALEMDAHPCNEAVVLDAGDLIEGFENTKGQAFTNDLSLPSMLRVARSVLTDMIGTVASRHAHTRVATVPSNHSAWRSGPGYLGKPSDDFGLDCHRAVSEVFAHANDSVEWVWPGDWDQSVALNISGARVGLTHGHYAKQRKFKEWLAGQALGDTILADCDIVVSGHFHNYLIEPCGFLNKRERTHIQAPTMDNGSEWWKVISGDDSAPGLLTFTIEDGRIRNSVLLQHVL
jgi:hypothetical protein